MEVLRWSLEFGGGLVEDLDEEAQREGPAFARTMAEGWRRLGWPGPLAPENRQMMEWAETAEDAGEAAADRLFRFPVHRGNEALVARRLSAARAFVRARRAKAADEGARHGR